MVEKDTSKRDHHFWFSLYLLACSLVRLIVVLLSLPLLLVAGVLRILPLIKHPANWAYHQIIRVLVPDK